MTAKKTGRAKKETDSSFDLGLGGIFKGFSDIVEKLSDLAEKGEEFKKTGEIKGLDKNVSGLFGISIKVGGLGIDNIKVEPFGNIHKDDEGKVTVNEVREPIVDTFEEKDHILVVAEMPGVDEKDIHIDLKDDILQISAETSHKKYQKEILLKECFTNDEMVHSYKNGILEIKLMKS